MAGWSKEVYKMVMYITVPVFSVWLFNKDFFRDNFTLPLLKRTMSREDYEILKSNACYGEEDDDD